MKYIKAFDHFNKIQENDAIDLEQINVNSDEIEDMQDEDSEETPGLKAPIVVPASDKSE